MTGFQVGAPAPTTATFDDVGRALDRAAGRASPRRAVARPRGGDGARGRGPRGFVFLGGVVFGPPEVVRAPPGSRVYFAYGSNVSSATFRGTRGIDPAESWPAVLPDYRLVFDVPGLPYVEPGFASVRRVSPIPGPPDPDDPLARYEREVHGMAYLVSDADWARILRTETGYAVEDVTLVRSSDGASIEAATLAYPSLDLGAAGTMPELLPSARYLGIIRAGAEEWSLDEGWRAWLRERVRAYDDPANGPPPPQRARSAPSSRRRASRRSPRSPRRSGSGSASPPARRARSTRRRRRAARAGRSREGGGRRGERGGGRSRRGGFRAFATAAWAAHATFWAPALDRAQRRRRRGRTMISSSETERRSGGRRAPGRAGSETTVARGTDSAVGRARR